MRVTVCGGLEAMRDHELIQNGVCACVCVLVGGMQGKKREKEKGREEPRKEIKIMTWRSELQ